MLEIIKKMSKQTALRGAFVCWVGLAFCLYSHHIFEFSSDIVAILGMVMNTFSAIGG